MTINKRDGKMKLALQMVSGYGGEFKTWRMAVADAYTNMDFYVENAKIAEKGKIHTLFIADTPALPNDLSTNSPMHPMDPTIALTAVARETKHIRIVSTYSTTIASFHIRLTIDLFISGCVIITSVLIKSAPSLYS